MEVSIRFAGLGITMGGSMTAPWRGSSSHNSGLLIFGMGLLMHSPNRTHPANAPQVIIWYPSESDDTSGEMRRKVKKEVHIMLTEAMLAALPEDHKIGEEFGFRARYISGPPECEDPGDGRVCHAWVLPYDPVRSTNLQGEEVWMWRNWQYFDKEDQRTGTVNGPKIYVHREGYKPQQLPIATDHAFLQRFSANLPSYIWVYAPFKEGVPPVMFNQGEPHFFLAPGVEVAATN